MPTAASSSTSFCSASEFRGFHDFRQLGDIADDTGTRVTDTTTFDASTTVANHLKAAAGLIESYAMRGARYSAADLAALTGVGLMLLKKLNADIAHWMFWARRHPDKPMTPSSQLAWDILTRLGNGELVFGLQEQIDAGLPDHDYLGHADFDRRGEITDQARRYMGIRAKTRRIGGAPWGGYGEQW